MSKIGAKFCKRFESQSKPIFLSLKLYLYLQNDSGKLIADNVNHVKPKIIESYCKQGNRTYKSKITKTKLV